MQRPKLLTVIAALAAAIGALAQVPSIINYQGRLSVDGTNVFDGTGQFKFALVSSGTNLNRQAAATPTVSGGFLTGLTITDGGWGYLETPKITITDTSGSNAVAKATITGGVVTAIAVANPGRNYSPSPTVTIEPPPPSFAFGTFWSNDGTSLAGSEPATAVALLVSQGLFIVNLGDTSVSNMTVVLDPMVFTNIDVRLRIWFNDGVAGFQQFYPDQRLTSAPYAMMAANLPNDSVTSAKIAPASVGAQALAPGAVSAFALAPGAVTANALAADAVGGANIQKSAITEDKLADAAVTTAKLAPGIFFGVQNSMTVFTSSGTWRRPEGVNAVHVKVWAGGGGGGSAGQGTRIGKGGGGGGYCEGVIAVTGDVTVTVGKGGTGIRPDGEIGEDGGSSSFLSLTANGGSGGPSGYWLSGGLGGTASGGLLNLPGKNGTSRGGAAPFGGIGGADGLDSAGEDGAFPGGGGGGGEQYPGVDTHGGEGAGGLVIIYY